MQQYHEDRLGLVLAFWGLGMHLGRPLISQTDYLEDGTIFGSVLNHVTDGRWTNGVHYHMCQYKLLSITWLKLDMP